MKKLIIIIFAVGCILCGIEMDANATSLVETMQKQFKKNDLFLETVIVKITVSTQVAYLKGNRRKNDFLRALKIHNNLIHVFKQNGWNKDRGFSENMVDGGLIELEIGEGMNLKFEEMLRLKAFIYPCESPMNKYRGGELGEFFKKVVIRTEKCLTEKLKLSTTY